MWWHYYRFLFPVETSHVFTASFARMRFNLHCYAHLAGENKRCRRLKQMHMSAILGYRTCFYFVIYIPSSIAEKYTVLGRKEGILSSSIKGNGPGVIYRINCVTRGLIRQMQCVRHNFVECSSSDVECRTRNRESPGSNPPIVL